ncbi:hypothetical protein Sgleb_67550 [Streptomyces glebosus]|uniref:Uncharacterized protein n=1 Tax=Streptomyces glebosus TaxID=249580 RepID=A0A640T5X9_9ACTN|nr:hypothetical protein Sgleb_67550 [Streptomyces glebosus]GHG49994.1 hypothetical protein GCM10010513_08450 [Streptomyces glebosus]
MSMVSQCSDDWRKSPASWGEPAEGRPQAETDAKAQTVPTVASIRWKRMTSLCSCGFGPSTRLPATAGSASAAKEKKARGSLPRSPAVIS